MRDEYQIMLFAWVLVSIWVGVVFLLNRRTHPSALFLLFLVELWERFSYYGMRALLMLYLTSMTMTGGFGIPENLAYGIYAAYGALVYLTPLAGGYLADKVLGFRKSIIWGALLMAAGQFTLSAGSGEAMMSHIEAKERAAATAAVAGEVAEASVRPTDSPVTESDTQNNKLFLYTGLALLVIGNGFFKPNISSLVGKYYHEGDSRRDGAFTIFYMGINIGAFLTPLTCGTIGEIEGWRYGFLCAGIGMMLGLGIFLATVRSGILQHHADPPATASQFWLPAPLIYLGTFLVIPVAGLLIHYNDVMDYILGVVGIGAVAYILYMSFQYGIVERQRIWVIAVLLIFTAVFWTFFELAGSALNLFTERNVNRNVFGLVTLTTSNFQAVNAFYIMLFAPIFSFMWVKLANNKMEPSAPVKFAMGLLLLGTGFLVLNLGKAAAVNGLMPAMFLLLLYLLHTLGELSLSPVGLSLVTKLAPAKIVGFMMGFWFLSSAIAHQAGKWIASETAADKDATPEQTLDLALGVFNDVGLFAIGSGVLLLLLSPVLKKWMHGVK
ncbi:MAG: peptide MFS transporter [Bacteroidales bacterium]|nr:peptide MFS transporter [Bacteroidales bacterium]